MSNDANAVQATLDQDQLAVQNAQKVLDDANASLAATQSSLDAAGRSDLVAVQNAQQAALLVQQTGSAYVNAMAAYASLSDSARGSQGREVARQMLRAAAEESDSESAEANRARIRETYSQRSGFAGKCRLLS